MTGIITSLIIISGIASDASFKPSSPFAASRTVYFFDSIFLSRFLSSRLSSTIKMDKKSSSELFSDSVIPLPATVAISSVLSELSVRINSAWVSFSKTSRSKGKVTLNSLPVPGWLLTSIFPWCISTNSLTSDKPMPDEGCRILLFLLSVSKRLKREPILSGAMPIPSSIMEMRIC